MRDLRRDAFGRCQLADPGVCFIAAAVIGSGVASAVGSASAANAQKDAANTAAQTQLTMYNQTRSDLSPFREGGQSAFTQLQSLFGFGPGGNGTPNASAATTALTQFPGYQFGLDQGQQSLDRSAASRGLTLSGAQLQDSQKFGTDYAMQQAWQPYVSQLDFMSNLGENAATATGQAGVGAAQGAAASQLAAGQASAAGSTSIGNIVGSGISQLGQQGYFNAAPASSGYASQTGQYGPISSDLTGLY